MEEEVKHILEEHEKLIREIRGHTKALHRALIFGTVAGVVRFVVLFVIPILLLYLYVVPAFQKYRSSFQSLQQGKTSVADFLREMPPVLRGLFPLVGVDLSELERQAALQQQARRIKQK